MNELNRLMVLVMVAAFSGFALLIGARHRDQQRRDRERRTFAVRFPRTLDEDQVRAFLAALVGMAHPDKSLLGRDAAVFEVVGTGRGISHRLRLPKGSATHYVAQLRATVPGVSIVEIKTDDKAHALPPLETAIELKVTKAGSPLNVSDPEATVRSLLAACTGLRSGEAVVWQLIVMGGTPHPVPSDPTPQSGVWSIFVNPTTKGRTASRKTVDEGLVQTTIRIGSRASTKERRAELVARLRRVAASVAAPGVRLVPRDQPASWVTRRVLNASTPLIAGSVVISRDEVVALAGWPIGAPAIPGLVLGRAPQLPVAPDVPRSGRIMGRSTVGAKRLVAQSIRGGKTNSLVVGPTGSGKSWLTIQMALGDIERGHGVFVLDPKASTIHALLERMPEKAIARTLVVDPTDSERPVPIPLLAHDDHGIRELAADTLVGLLRHRYSDLGPRSTDILTSTLYALARVPGATLFDVFKVWNSPAFRASVVARCTDDVALMSFFAWFDGLSSTERNFVISAPSNKIRPLVQRPILRNVIAAPRATFTLSEALRDNLNVFVMLPEGLIGSEATTLIGQVVLARLWAAIQARDKRAASHPYWCYIDEAPRFTDSPTDLGDWLARDREYGVGTTLIAQTIAQFTPTLRAVALNSARNKVIFQTTGEDARRIADELGPLVTPDMIAGLEAFTAIATVSTGGATTDPFTMSTLPLGEVIPGRARAVRLASRNTWGIDKGEIEASFRLPTASGENEPPKFGRREVS